MKSGLILSIAAILLSGTTAAHALTPKNYPCKAVFYKKSPFLVPPPALGFSGTYPLPHMRISYEDFLNGKNCRIFVKGLSNTLKSVQNEAECVNPVEDSGVEPWTPKDGRNFRLGWVYGGCASKSGFVKYPTEDLVLGF